MLRRNCNRLAMCLACFIAGGCIPSLALQRVTLRNGFSYDCVRAVTLSGGHVRLFLSDGSSGAQAANYIDLAAERIASVESIQLPPDPLPVPSPKASTISQQTDVRSLLLHAGNAHNIDTELLASVVHAESNGRATAVSHAGAGGLMQLMPETARDLGVQNIFEPGQNIDGGTAYLDLLLTRYHDNLALALAAYNAGPAAVDRFHGIPPFRETRLYVVRVMNEFKRRKLALLQASPSISAAAQALRAAR